MYSQELKALSGKLLSEGRQCLGLSLGIVSRIIDEDYEIVAVCSDTGVFVAGETFALKDTYCREVVTKKQTIALTEMEGSRGLQKHPLYGNLPLEAYISSPILVDDTVWGTINFSSMKLREKSFSSEEVALVEDAAQQLTTLIAQSNSSAA